MSAFPENGEQTGPAPDGMPESPSVEPNAAVSSQAVEPSAAVSSQGEELAADPEAGVQEDLERRVYPRRKKFLRVLVCDTLSTAEFPGWVVDRSLGGMCLTVDREIEEGTVLKVRRPSESNGTWVEVRVQSVRPRDENWDLGCEFLRTPTWEVLLQFG